MEGGQFLGGAGIGDDEESVPRNSAAQPGLQSPRESSIVPSDLPEYKLKIKIMKNFTIAAVEY